MKPGWVLPIQKANRVRQVGHKAFNLHWLARHGFPIPQTYVIPFPAAAALAAGDPAARPALLAELAARLDPQAAYAVRSSADLEDGQQHSYAGQFKTILDTRGLHEILTAVEAVLAAARSPRARAYAAQAGQDLAGLQVAVILQAMVAPLVSGVAFSKNPLTGLNEVVVEALPGSGEALVQEGRTPARWVWRWGKWIAQPAEGEIPEALVRQVATETERIAARYGRPVDLEWVYDGQALHWVQLRPITRLEEINLYSNRISREMFPGQIKPLIWSVNIPLVNSAWIRLLTELIGPNDLQPEDLARSFAYRAYFNMGVMGRIFTRLGFPKESLELLLGLEGGEQRPRFRPSLHTLTYLPRMLLFLTRLLAAGRRVAPLLAAVRPEYAALYAQPLPTLTDPALLAAIHRLDRLTRRLAYFNILIPLLMNFYNLLLRRRLAGVGVDFAGFDLTHGLSELQAYDPNPHLQRLAAHYHRLDPAARQALETAPQIAPQVAPQVAPQPAPHAAPHAGFHTELLAFLEQFGHLSDSGNDFSAVPWREDPALVLQMVRLEAGRLEAPRPEPAPPEAARLTWQSLSLSPLRRALLAPFYHRARQFRLHREAISSAYTFGYGLFRRYYLEAGRRLAARGCLAHAEDIFYLTAAEVAAALASAGEPDLPARAAARRAEMAAARDRPLPETIYGDELPPPHDPAQGGSLLCGIPTSRGYHTGPAAVIRSLAEAGRLSPGDVLVIPYSDVSWTPLFTRAGAVVAESGGLLSHSSIVAREYNLPCVVSVPQACSIPPGTQVSVDGYTGEIYLHPAP